MKKDSNATAIGIFKKMKKADFIGLLYISKNVVPVLLKLSKVFKKYYLVCKNCSAIRTFKHSLQWLVHVGDKSPNKQFKRETSTGNLACLELSEDEIQNTRTKM